MVEKHESDEAFVNWMSTLVLLLVCGIRVVENYDFCDVSCFVYCTESFALGALWNHAPNTGWHLIGGSSFLGTVV